MTCNPTTIQLSSSGTTTINVTLSTDPGDGTAVTLEVDGLSISESASSSSGAVVFTVAAQTAANYSLWDATIQVGSNLTVDATAQVVETNGAQTIGVTITDAAVSYCSPLSGGGSGSGTVTSITAGSGLTGGTITASGTIAHQAQPASGTGPAFVKSVEIDSFGHVTSVTGETTAGAYRTATGTDDAANLTTGTLATARLDVGTSANQIVQLDGSAKLPAVDGSALTNLPSGTTEKQWGQAPQTVVRLFEDFQGAEAAGNGNDWWNADTNGSYSIKRAFMGSEGADTFGRIIFDSQSGDGAVSSWGQISTGIVSRITPVTGDEIIWECNVSFEASTTTAGANLCAISIFDPTLSAWNSDGLGWYSQGMSTPPNRVVIGSIGGEANWRYAVTESNVEDLTGSSSDTGVAVTFDENVYERIGIKLVKTSTSNQWTYNVYVAGTSVGTGTFTTSGQLACTVIQQASDSTNNDMNVDWMSLQYTRPTVSHLVHSGA